jgi:hypothetical protein
VGHKLQSLEKIILKSLTENKLFSGKLGRSRKDRVDEDREEK